MKTLIVFLVCPFYANHTGGGSGKYLRNVCWKFVPAVIRHPPTNFFHKLHFFSTSFSGPTNFFPKIQIFSSEIWRPTHIFTENLHLPNFRPLNSRPLSVFEGLFGDIWFFDEFSSFWALQTCKIVKNDPFLMYFF